MTYTKALAEARRVGANHAKGDAELARVCYVLAAVHAVNPRCLYGGAQARGLTGRALAGLAETDLAEFATIQFD